MSLPKAISLFSGAGGDTEGLTAAGYDVIAYSENNAAAIATHQARFPTSVLLKDPTTGSTDIRKIPDSVFTPYAGQIMALFAGFPCQGFSHAGKKRADDPRNELVYEFARVARLVRPMYIIGENVAGLLSRMGRDPSQPPTAPLRPVIEIIRDLFVANGYRITYRVVPAVDVGVPQRRKRLLIVGLRSTRFWPHISWPAPATSDTLPTIRHILEPHLDGAIPAPTTAIAPDPHFWIETTQSSPTGTPHPNLVRLAGGVRNLSSKERAVAPAGTATTIVEPGGLLSFGTRSSSYHGEIVDPDAPSKTIICTYGLCPRLFVGLRNPTTGHTWIRCMTPRELGQVQGFPADYPWQGDTKAQITQIGNAVPPALATFVGNTIKRVHRSLTPQTAATDDDEDTESDAD
jgi:DNA (cytosine-5)-methyltransferase 1